METRVDPDGMVRFPAEARGAGLLGMFGGPARELRANDLEPWQCAGGDVSGEIDLAFKLWLDGFPPFRDVLLRHGIGEVFSAIGLSDKARASLDSMLRLNELLTSLLIDDAVSYLRMAAANARHAHARQRSIKALDETGRQKSIETRRKNAQELNERIAQIARDYFRKHPSHELEDVIAHLRRWKEFSKLSDGAVRKRLKGVGGQALRIPL